MNSACRARRHTWATNPPVPGTRCTKPDCGKTFGGAASVDDQPKNQGSTPARDVDPGPGSIARQLGDRAERLRAALASRASQVVSAVADVDDDEPIAPTPPSAFARHLGKKATILLDAGTDFLLEKMKRKPNNPDPADLQDFEDGAAEQLHIWLGQAEVPPWAKCLMATGFIVGGKAIGSEKIAPAPKAPLRLVPPDTSPDSAPGADAISAPQPQQSPSPVQLQPPPTADPDAPIPPRAF